MGFRTYVFIEGGHIRAGLERIGASWPDLSLRGLAGVLPKLVGIQWQDDYLRVSRILVYDAVPDPSQSKLASLLLQSCSPPPAEDGGSAQLGVSPPVLIPRLLWHARRPSEHDGHRNDDRRQEPEGCKGSLPESSGKPSVLPKARWHDGSIRSIRECVLGTVLAFIVATRVAIYEVLYCLHARRLHDDDALVTPVDRVHP